MGLTQINFQSGIRMIMPIDTVNDVVTDIKTETMRSEFIFLGVGDSIDNYKAINKDTPIPEAEKQALEQEWEVTNE